MKYQSEIIKEIIDTRGHDKSSLHYESECIESWIEETKGAYPKLCDYQSEWMNYINESPIGEFPYETLIDVTKATINNVVPYAYKSAILKGKTDENLQSVQMPVLTTTGKNLANTTIASGLMYYDSGLVYQSNLFYVTDFIKIHSNTVYSFNMGQDQRYCLFDSNKKYITGLNAKTFNSGDASFVRFSGISTEVMMVEGSNPPTLYEPFKSNILTTSEDVELRGIGDVQDTLDCLTGEVTQRIGEIVLDGSLQPEGMYDKGEKTKGFFFPSNTIQLKSSRIEDIPKMVMCDKFRVMSNDYQWSGAWLDEEFLSVTDDGRIAIRLDTTKASTINELHQYLSQNPITVQYPLKTESVKTVDLTVVNQDGENVSLKPIEGTMNLSTSSETINPLFSGEIPVEAITQNLSSFIEE